MSSTRRVLDAMSPQAREVCRQLRRAGYRAVAVGGAVRDVLLGVEPGDWDVASDAVPEEVMRLFARTIPTGIKHGTVTVVVGSGADRQEIEVTTFRSEGDYSDSRHPDGVVFGVPLSDDLGRRDFTVNALAFDPDTGELIDPFHGVQDLSNRVLRAVGNPSDRFSEDGLRVMRAVRFVSQLGFALDAATEVAISAALPALARVAQERIRVELFKLLSGSHVGDALTIAETTGVLACVLPECQLSEKTCEWVERTAADPILRLAVLCAGTARSSLERAMRRLTLSNQDRVRLLAIASHANPTPPQPMTAVAVRQLLRQVTRARCSDVLELWRGYSRAHADEAAVAILTAKLEAENQQRHPISVAELPITGRELMTSLGLNPGPQIGELLEYLLDCVVVDPDLADHESLVELARRHLRG